MLIKVRIPTALRQFAEDKDTIELEGEKVGQVLVQLGERFPELRRHLFDDAGQVRNFVNVYVKDENIRDLQQQDTPLKPGDDITIVPAIAGGMECDSASSAR